MKTGCNCCSLRFANTRAARSRPSMVLSSIMAKGCARHRLPRKLPVACVSLLSPVVRRKVGSGEAARLSARVSSLTSDMMIGILRCERMGSAVSKASGHRKPVAMRIFCSTKRSAASLPPSASQRSSKRSAGRPFLLPRARLQPVGCPAVRRCRKAAPQARRAHLPPVPAHHWPAKRGQCLSAAR